MCPGSVPTVEGFAESAGLTTSVPSTWATPQLEKIRCWWRWTPWCRGAQALDGFALLVAGRQQT